MRPLFAATVAVVLAPVALAQERPSHREIPHDRHFDRKRAFEEKFRNSQVRGEVESLLRQLGQGQGGPLADQLRAMVEKDPALLEKAREMLGSNDPKTRDLVRGAIGGALRGNPALNKLDLTPEQLQHHIEQAFGNRKFGETARSEGRAESRPTESSEDARRAWARDLAAWAERMNKNKLAASLKNSAAVSGLLNDLTKAGIDSVKSGRQGEGFDAQLSRWQDQVQAARDWLPDELPAAIRERFNGLELPTPEFTAPQFDAPAGLGRISSPTIGGVANVIQVAAYIAAAAAAIVLLRRMHSAAGVTTRRRRGLTLSLDANSLANRADVIRAFETLAILRHGEPARSWHHRATAARFPSVERDAADRLANLYESARYSPGGPEPSAEQLASARRDVARLAEAL